MLTEGQQKYIDAQPDDLKVSVKPWNPKCLVVANSIISKVHAAEPSLKVIVLGSAVLKIAGQEDIDISAFCIKSEQDKYLPIFKHLFGEPKRIGKASIGWEFQQDGFSVSVWLTDPTAQTTKLQLAIFKQLQENPTLLKEYEQIKLDAKGASYKEYQRRKYEFYNRVLSLSDTATTSHNSV